MRYAKYIVLAVLAAGGVLAAQAPAGVQKLTAAQDAARSNTDFQTHHFMATAAIAKAVGAPLGPLTEGSGAALTANEAAAKLAASGSGYREVQADEAQKLADQGSLVIVAWTNSAGAGHLATVRPSGVSGDDVKAGSRNPLINNVGVDVGVEGVNWVFRKDAELHYYTPGSGQ